MIKTPNYKAFIQYLFDNGVLDWNPDEYEDWELPPSWCLVYYFELFPLDEPSEVVDFISPASGKRIEKYFGLNSA